MSRIYPRSWPNRQNVSELYKDIPKTIDDIYSRWSCAKIAGSMWDFRGSCATKKIRIDDRHISSWLIEIANRYRCPVYPIAMGKGDENADYDHFHIVVAIEDSPKQMESEKEQRAEYKRFTRIMNTCWQDGQSVVLPYKRFQVPFDKIEYILGNNYFISVRQKVYTPRRLHRLLK